MVIRIDLICQVKIFLMKLDGDSIILSMQDKDRRLELLEKVKEVLVLINQKKDEIVEKKRLEAEVKRNQEKKVQDFKFFYQVERERKREIEGVDCEIERVRGRKRFRDSERERLRVREREIEQKKRGGESENEKKFKIIFQFLQSID